MTHTQVDDDAANNHGDDDADDDYGDGGDALDDEQLDDPNKICSLI